MRFKVGDKVKMNGNVFDYAFDKNDILEVKSVEDAGYMKHSQWLGLYSKKELFKLCREKSRDVYAISLAVGLVPNWGSSCFELVERKKYV